MLLQGLGVWLKNERERGAPALFCLARRAVDGRRTDQVDEPNWMGASPTVPCD